MLKSFRQFKLNKFFEKHVEHSAPLYSLQYGETSFLTAHPNSKSASIDIKLANDLEQCLQKEISLLNFFSRKTS